VLVDFVNLATVEFVGAIEAQRAYERGQRRWLLAWRRLHQEARDQATPISIPVVKPDESSEKRAA
jgi:hypothetical protein